MTSEQAFARGVVFGIQIVLYPLLVVYALGRGMTRCLWAGMLLPAEAWGIPTFASLWRDALGDEA